MTMDEPPIPELPELLGRAERAIEAARAALADEHEGDLRLAIHELKGASEDACWMIDTW